MAVLAHGAGSTADFVLRTFGPPLAAAGLRAVSWDSRGPGLVGQLARAVRDTDARVVGGVSVGAHAAVRWAAGSGAALDGLLLALPGWVGPPGPAARLAARDAAGQAGAAPAVVTGELRGRAPGWVVDELVAGWSRYPAAELAAALRRAARSAGPTADELAAVRAPAGVVSLAGDPFHPEQVARRWVALLPRAVLRVLPADAPAADRTVLGAAAVSCLRRAGGLTGVTAPR